MSPLDRRRFSSPTTASPCPSTKWKPSARASISMQMFTITTKSVGLVPRRPNLCDLNDCKSKGQTHPFEVIPGVSRTCRGWIHKGKDIANDRIPRPFSPFHGVPSDVGYRPGKPIDSYKEQLRKDNENSPSLLRLPIAKVQFGVWFTPPDQGRAFSVEYEQEYLGQSANLAHRDNLICIDVSSTLSTTRMN